MMMVKITASNVIYTLLITFHCPVGIPAGAGAGYFSLNELHYPLKLSFYAQNLPLWRDATPTIQNKIKAIKSSNSRERILAANVVGKIRIEKYERFCIEWVHGAISCGLWMKFSYLKKSKK